ncbi:MAG: ABC transporter ATP-binding protein [Lachnospiraceae bacterium]|nr:ABC transporter ATP-binding protein [Lachnospiraceae bacterium]
MENKLSAEKDILRVENVHKSFRDQNAPWSLKRKKKEVLKGIAFSVKEGEVLGLVGESGCGKSTLAKVILGLETPDSGNVIHESMRPQMVFQDPYSSLNPAKKIGWILEEPLRLRGGFSKEERKKRVFDMLGKVGLDEKIAERYPNQLSGGQRQRICIAAALMLEPKLLIADEAVSALDVTIQAQIIELLLQLKEQMGLSILFISHDMRVVYQVSDRVMIMQEGKIVEIGDVDDVYFESQHPYTRELLEAAGIIEEGD